MTPAPPPAPPPGDSAVPPAPFALSPVWGTPVAATAAPDPDSDRLVAILLARVAAEQAAGTGPRLGTDTRTPLYRVGPDQPTVPVYLDTGPWGDRLAARFQAGVPIPNDAQPVSGSDRALAVWQPATDTYWEFFKMQQSLHVPQFLGAAEVTAGCALSADSYAYAVTAVSANGETNPPAGGANATVSADGGCVALRWRGVSGAGAYRIYRGADGSSPTYLATVAPTLTSFDDDGSAVPDGTAPPSTNTATTPGEWHASYGGVIADVAQSPGYYRDRVGGDGEVLEQSNWGSAATATPLAAGLITKEDIERGSIDHAVSIGLDNSGEDAILRAGQFAFPAQGTDGRSSAPDSIPEGARLVLDPGVDIGALGLPPLARMLAEAAQRYGLIVQDGSMSTVVYAEDPAPYVRAGQPNFYRPLVGSSSVRALRSFPWEYLEVAGMHLCTRHPCSAD